MPWARFDDAYPNSRKVRPLSDAAFRLDVSAICWSNANLTDGFIADDELHAVSDVRRPAQAARELVARGRWERHDDRGGYRIHDFHDYNPTKTKVLEDRAAAAERQRKAREKRAESRAKSQGESHDESRSDNSVSHAPPDPTRPDPTPSTSTQVTSAAASTRPREPNGSSNTTPDQLLDQTGPWSPVIRQALTGQIRDALNAGIDTQPIAAALTDYRTRDKPRPGLLGHLIQDQLTRNGTTAKATTTQRAEATLAIARELAEEGR